MSSGQGYPKTVFSKMSVQRSKYYLEFFFWGGGGGRGEGAKNFVMNVPFMYNLPFSD